MLHLVCKYVSKSDLEIFVCVWMSSDKWMEITVMHAHDLDESSYCEVTGIMSTLNNPDPGEVQLRQVCNLGTASIHEGHLQFLIYTIGMCIPQGYLPMLWKAAL